MCAPVALLGAGADVGGEGGWVRSAQTTVAAGASLIWQLPECAPASALSAPASAGPPAQPNEAL